MWKSYREITQSRFSSFYKITCSNWFIIHLPLISSPYKSPTFEHSLSLSSIHCVKSKKKKENDVNPNPFLSLLCSSRILKLSLMISSTCVYVNRTVLIEALVLSWTFIPPTLSRRCLMIIKRLWNISSRCFFSRRVNDSYQHHGISTNLSSPRFSYVDYTSTDD